MSELQDTPLHPEQVRVIKKLALEQRAVVADHCDACECVECEDARDALVTLRLIATIEAAEQRKGEDHGRKHARR